MPRPTPEVERHAPVMIHRPGSEPACGPTEEQLVILPGVPIQDFVGQIVACGFPLICHMHCKDPARHVRYGFPMGQVHMIFTDGQFALPVDATDLDALAFLTQAQLLQATYVAHVKTLEVATGDPTEFNAVTPGSQVVIVSTHKAATIRRMFTEAGFEPGRAELTFYRGSLV